MYMIIHEDILFKRNYFATCFATILNQVTNVITRNLNCFFSARKILMENATILLK